MHENSRKREGKRERKTEKEEANKNTSEAMLHKQVTSKVENAWGVMRFKNL